MLLFSSLTCVLARFFFFCPSTSPLAFCPLLAPPLPPPTPPSSVDDIAVSTFYPPPAPSWCWLLGCLVQVETVVPTGCGLLCWLASSERLVQRIRHARAWCFFFLGMCVPPSPSLSSTSCLCLGPVYLFFCRSRRIFVSTPAALCSGRGVEG